MTGYVNPYAGLSEAELDAAFTKEDPRYPARKKASEALHKHISQWIEEYEFDNGEGGYHSPSEFERALIYDAFYGLTADADYERWHTAKRLIGLNNLPAWAQRAFARGHLNGAKHV